MQIQMQRTLDAAPVEYEGTVNGRPFYFPARCDGWFFGIGDTVDAASIADSSLEDQFFREAKYGDGPYDASYMTFSEAERIIHKCALAYLATLGSR